MKQDARISDCGLYRYTLLRQWSDAPLLAALWLNPSTADASQDDPSLRRGVAFAKRGGFGGLLLANPFAFRATNFQDLLDSCEAGIDVIGPENDYWIGEVVHKAYNIVWCGWGANAKHPIVRRRVNQLIGQFRQWNTKMYHLGLTKDGHPKHPLYLRADAPMVEWNPATAPSTKAPAK